MRIVVQRKSLILRSCSTRYIHVTLQQMLFSSCASWTCQRKLPNGQGQVSESHPRAPAYSSAKVFERRSRCSHSNKKWFPESVGSSLRVCTETAVHPVIATRWAGTLGKKSKKLMMIMCANHGYNPDGRVSFSCRLSAPLRRLPEGERRELMSLVHITLSNSKSDKASERDW